MAISKKGPVDRRGFLKGAAAGAAALVAKPSMAMPQQAQPRVATGLPSAALAAARFHFFVSIQ